MSGTPLDVETQARRGGLQYVRNPGFAEPLVRTRYRVIVLAGDVPVFDGVIADDDSFTLVQAENTSAKVALSATAHIELAVQPPADRRDSICGEPGCDEPIIFVPTSGFGARGEWQHRRGGPPLGKTRAHMARPKVYVW